MQEFVFHYRKLNFFIFSSGEKMYTQTLKCPQCSKPTTVQIEQIFDYNVNPSALYIFFDETINAIQCDNCGFYGKIAVPIVYHDPDKELLFTFVPSELGIPRDEQEKIIGNLIKVIIESLPSEKRKAYLLNPQSFFTYESLIDKLNQTYNLKTENIEESKQKLDIIRRIIAAESMEQIDTIIKEEKDQIDEQLFIHLSQIIESIAGNDSTQQVVQSLELKYNRLLSNTEAGKHILQGLKEINEVRNMLEEAGDFITREKILNIAIASSDSEQKIRYLVSNTRPLMDYTFFQLLTEKIANAKSTEQKKLMELRSILLSETENIDKDIETLRTQAKEHFDKMIQSPDIESVVLENLPLINNFFIERVNYELIEAIQEGDQKKEEKIKKMQAIINKLVFPSKAQFFMDLINLPDEKTVRDYIINNHIIVDNKFINDLEMIKGSLPENTSKEMLAQINMVINAAKNMVK